MHKIIHEFMNRNSRFLAHFFFRVSDLVDIHTFDMIEKATKKLKSSFSPGPDGIPSAVLKRCANQLIEPLLVIFNLSLRQATFPTAWKKSFIFPIFKKGSKRSIENY